MTSAILGCLLTLVPAAAPDTVVVCPAAYRAALAPWLELRRAQGHEIELVNNAGSADDIRGRIRAAGQAGKLKFVVLVGSGKFGDAAAMAERIPPCYVKAKVDVRFGSEPEIATDNGYADLDGDDLPDVALGRLTAASTAELATIVQKILAYEANSDFDRWRTRVNFVAGLGGFGPLADAALETGAKSLITSGVPAGYATSMTYASWRSPYCPDPRLFHQTTIDRLHEGCLFWVYLGHGQPRQLDRAHMPNGDYDILNTADIRGLGCTHGAPIAFFMACYAGAFDARDNCLAEEMLRTPGAPVAAIGGSRVTMPYAMTVLGSSLLDQCFVEHRATLGEVLLHAKRKLGQPATERGASLLDLAASVLGPQGSSLDDERREHVQLFNLIGDPLLTLHHPRPVQITVGPAVSGGQIEVTGTSPVDGLATVELVVRRDRLTFQPPERGKFELTAESSFQKVYDGANDPRLAQFQCTVTAGKFSTRLNVPADAAATGACHVRVFIQGRSDFALGACDVEIRAAAAASK